MAYMLNAKSVICPPTECNQASVDLSIKEVDDLVVHGRITDCDGNGIEGVIVKAFEKKGEGNLVGITHTFSGCGGYYMISVPKDIGCENIVIMAASSSCPLPQPCENDPCDL